VTWLYVLLLLYNLKNRQGFLSDRMAHTVKVPYQYHSEKLEATGGVCPQRFGRTLAPSEIEWCVHARTNKADKKKQMELTILKFMGIAP